jgi:anti-sigma B factor antagonist
MVESPSRPPLQTPPAARPSSDKETPLPERTDDGGSLRREPVISTEKTDDACIVRLAGELDLYNAHAVRDALLEACADGPARVIVDLSEVEFIDSTALGVLIEARTKLPNRQAFLLAAPGLETRRALQISGLDRHFSVHQTVPEALEAAV